MTGVIAKRALKLALSIGAGEIVGIAGAFALPIIK